MRILYSFPHAIGAPGIGTTAISQVLGLIERGHDVTVVAASVHKNAPDLAAKVLQTMVFGGARVPHRVLGMDRTMAYHDIRTAAHLRRNPSAFDVVHCWPGAALASAKTASELGVPLLREVPNTHTANAYDVVAQLCMDLGIQLPKGHSHSRNGERLRREDAEYAAAFRLLVPSEHVMETFLVRGFARDRLLRHQYGFEANKFTPSSGPRSGPFKAIFMGSVEPRKGLHIALEAWRRSGVPSDSQLAIYGRIVPGYDQVLDKFRDLPGVTFHGFTDDTAGVMRAADVLLLPSFEEGSALVTYEAQGCGAVPLVSGAAGAECVNEVTALVHKAGDVDALARQLRQMALEPDRLQRMRAAVLANRDALTWAAAAYRLEQCYIAAQADMASTRRVRTSSKTTPKDRSLPSPKRSVPSSNPTAQDVVFTFWAETWADAVRREIFSPDRLVQTLLSHERVDRLLVANPYRSAVRAMARRLVQSGGPAFPSGNAAALTSPLRLRRNDGLGERSLRKTYEAYDRELEAHARRLGMDRPAVITTNPFYAAFGHLDWAGPVTYYAWDDWAALPALKPQWADFDTAYRAMSERGTRVCAVSATLIDRIAPTGPHAVVPNGVSPSEWQPPWKVPDWLTPLPSPRILYLGAIHERLDIEAMRQISASFPTASILVVGPAANMDVVGQLQTLSNVHIHAPLPHSEVVGLTHSADVCIMPHHSNALTESMSPLKVYEYCASGRPVVVTDLSPVRNVHKAVRLVPPGGSFVEAIHEALKDGPMPEAERQAFLQRNSWEGRHEAILDLALA
jgi:teichuronic acid biosynthesis glycosyltransferase TuaH